MLLLSDFAAFEIERQITSDGVRSIDVVTRPIDGTVRFVMRNKRRGTNSHFETLAEAVTAFNEAPTGA